MKIVGLIQARVSSRRLPGKVLSDLGAGYNSISLMLERVRRCKYMDFVAIATTIHSSDDEIFLLSQQLGVECFRGSENDVLDRYYRAAKAYNADAIVRLTGDCPFIDPDVIDLTINTFKDNSLGYCANNIAPTFPDGLDVEVFGFSELEEANQNAFEDYEREHVTSYIRRQTAVKSQNISFYRDLSDWRLTLDEPEDLALIRDVFKALGFSTIFSLQDIIDYIDNRPSVLSINSMYRRNEGATMHEGQKLWRRAERVLAGGNSLLSKRPDMWLPGSWPTYFESTSGITVEAFDGTSYIDMSLMGIGTNLLGYSHPYVDNAVADVVRKGNLSTLNSVEEVLLAETLISLHPWADQVRFARSGGEANAVAIRLARAATGRNHVAVCGYHGWHDWYLACNLNSPGSLSKHLLEGLPTSGVDLSLGKSASSFSYNSFTQLDSIFDLHRHDLAAVIMEVQRNVAPLPDFLEHICRRCKENGVVLIFDECSSGFRETFGGLHLKYGVSPDMAMFGKALGNGYAITAVLGRYEIMSSINNTFISSTFWSERIGPAAALATLKVMKDEESWVIASNTGDLMLKIWQDCASKYNLSLLFSGIRSMPSFSFKSEHDLLYKTFLTQFFVDNCILASNTFYASTAHLQSHLNQYAAILDNVFRLISEDENSGRLIHRLRGPIKSTTFQRLN